MSSRNVRPTQRSGFTLVELLVAIGIISILAAMLLPAISKARYAAWKSQVGTELANISRGFQAFSDLHGGQPPDFSDIGLGWTNTAAYRYIRKTWPKISASELAGIQWLATNGHMDRGTCVWFWLAGMSESATNPFTGDGGPLSAEHLNNSHFDFQLPRLISRSVTITVSGTNIDLNLKRYMPVKISQPFVYFDSRTYAGATYTGSGTLRPYMTYEIIKDSSNNDVPDYQFANRNTFQVVAAGRDNTFAGPDFAPGSVAGYPLIPDKIGYHADPSTPPPSNYFDNHKDNLTNFSEGRLLEDLE